MAAGMKRFSKRYAKMLFNVTGMENAEGAIRDLTLLNRAMAENRDIRNLFISPLISQEEREGVLNELSERFGLSGELKIFLLFISEKRAVTALPDIIDRFRDICYERKRKAKATVVTPLKFNGGYEKRLIKSLSKVTNREIEVEYVYDPELIGGIVVKIGSTMFDSSLKGQLRLLRQQLVPKR